MLSVAEAARRAGVSKTAIRNACDSGRLRSVRLRGGDRVIDPDDLERYASTVQWRRRRAPRVADVEPRVEPNMSLDIIRPPVVSSTSSDPETARLLERIERQQLELQAARIELAAVELKDRLRRRRRQQRIRELVAGHEDLEERLKAVLEPLEDDALYSANARKVVQIVFSDERAEHAAREAARTEREAAVRARVAALMCELTRWLAHDGWTPAHIGAASPAAMRAFGALGPALLDQYAWPLHLARVEAYRAMGWQPPPPFFVTTPNGPRPVLPGD